MRRGFIAFCLIALAVGGFYVGKTVAPGVLAHGAGFLAAFGRQPEGQSPNGGTAQGGTAPGTGTPAPGTQAPGAQPPTGSGNPAQPTGGAPASTKNLWIDVDISDQKVRIMDGDKVSKEITCSTGIKGEETPLGTFEIQNRGEWFFSDKFQQGAKYWVSFKDWGVYLFHSIVMDKDQKVIPEEEARLGTPASHGCIRMPMADAKWIYDNMPDRAKVVIHD